MSWERSRFIPWSRIQDVSGPDGYESQKEKVYRALAREATREKDLLEHSKNNASQATPNAQSFVPPEVLAQQAQKKKGLFNSGVDYSTPDLVRTLAFGGCIGAITGYWVSIWLHGWDENSTGKLYHKERIQHGKDKIFNRRNIKVRDNFWCFLFRFSLLEVWHPYCYRSWSRLRSYWCQCS